MKICDNCQTPAACKAHEECLKPPVKEPADSGSDAAACSARRYPSRRTFRITGAPECTQPTADDIRRLLNKARPDSEWTVQEIAEDGSILPQNAKELATEPAPKDYDHGNKQ